MGKSLNLAGLANGQATAYNASSPYTFLAGGDLPFESAEANVQNGAGVAGTLTNLAVNINATGTTRSVSTRKNTAAGGQTCTIGDGLSGIFEDTTHSDTAAAGDLFDTAMSEAGADPTTYWVRALFSATSNHASFWGCFGGGLITTASTSFYTPIAGGDRIAAPGTTVGDFQVLARAPGSLSYFGVYVTTNARASNTTARTNINGTPGNNTMTVTASTTGRFSDTTPHSDTIASGDLVAAELLLGTGSSNFSCTGRFVSFTNTTNTKNDLFGTSNGANGARTASATVHYFMLGASHTFSSAVTTESQAAVTHSFSGTASRLRMFLSANTYTGNGTVRFRKNAGNGNQLLTLTASTTGLFEDTTNTDSFNGTDTCNLSIADGTANSITVKYWAVTEEEAGAAATVGRGLLESILLAERSLVN